MFLKRFADNIFHRRVVKYGVYYGILSVDKAIIMLLAVYVLLIAKMV